MTGGNGQLGGELTAVASASGHAVVATTRSDCDITDPAAVERVLDESEAEVLVNCAGWTRVDDAETDREAAFRANALGPRVLAAACRPRDVLLVQLSSDYVFDGTATTPIDEGQQPHPRSVYGASKLAGEAAVRDLAPRHQVVRTSWLYGRRGPNFVLAILSAAGRDEPLRVVADQVGAPTWTGHLAPALLRLIARDVTGTFHLTNSGATSWYGLAEAILAETGSAATVMPVATADRPSPARRPPYSVLDNRAWRLLGESPLPDWHEALASYLRSLGEHDPPVA